MFGLLVLVVIGPKYVARQEQIEREYRGRQAVLSGARALEALEEGVDEGAAAESPTRQTEIPLQPLYFALAAIAAAAWFLFWRKRSRRPSARSDLSGTVPL